jgi:hypothetical protein
MKFKNHILALLALSSVLACDSQKEEGINPLFSETDLFPLAIGKTFNYWIKTFDEDGKETADRRFSQTISGDTLIQGKTWFKNDATSTFLSNQTDGLHYFYSFNGEESLIYKYPAGIGDVYDSFVFTYKPETDDKFETITGVKSVEVLSTNTTVVSPLSGTKYKNCIH